MEKKVGLFVWLLLMVTALSAQSQYRGPSELQLELMHFLLLSFQVLLYIQLLHT